MIVWMVGRLGLVVNIMFAVCSQSFPRLSRRPCNLQRSFPNSTFAVSNGPVVRFATFASGHCCLWSCLVCFAILLIVVCVGRCAFSRYCDLQLETAQRRRVRVQSALYFSWCLGLFAGLAGKTRGRAHRLGLPSSHHDRSPKAALCCMVRNPRDPNIKVGGALSCSASLKCWALSRRGGSTTPQGPLFDQGTARLQRQWAMRWQ